MLIRTIYLWINHRIFCKQTKKVNFINNNTLDLTEQTAIKQTISVESKELLALTPQVALINFITKRSITYASIAEHYNLNQYAEVRELQQRLAQAQSSSTYTAN